MTPAATPATGIISEGSDFEQRRDPYKTSGALLSRATVVVSQPSVSKVLMSDTLDDLLGPAASASRISVHLRFLRSYKETEILPFSSSRVCLVGADAEQRRLAMWDTAKVSGACFGRSLKESDVGPVGKESETGVSQGREAFEGNDVGARNLSARLGRRRDSGARLKKLFAHLPYRQAKGGRQIRRPYVEDIHALDGGNLGCILESRRRFDLHDDR